MSKEFKRKEWSAEKRVGSSWRKPRGVNSKIRVREKSKGRAVKVGHRSPVKGRGFHPSGFKEFLINNESQLDMAMKLKDEKVAIRIAAGVGGRKKAIMVKKADEAKLKILNR